MSVPSCVLGILVGGASRRMGGHPKGLLPAPDTGEPIIVRLARLGRAAGLDVVLVGRADAYSTVLPGVRALVDEPTIVGPMGGLASVLRYAAPRPTIVVGCDAPYVTVSVFRRLASPAWTAPVVAIARSDGAGFEPLPARYDPVRVLPVVESIRERGERSFRALLRSLEVDTLPLEPGEERAAIDWDSPQDVRYD